MPDPIAPIVNTNGTNPEELLEDISFARLRIRDTEEALKHCGPNGRDSQTAPNEQEHLRDRIAQHSRRMKVLSDLDDELEREAELIREQMDAKHTT